VKLTAAYRHDCDGVTALVTDTDVTTACGITCGRTWWCECGTLIDGTIRDVQPADVCSHLRVLGMAPKTTAT
jgi:hypothetical protein